VKLSIGIIVGFSIFVGCEKQDEIIPEDSIAETEDFAPEGKMMILGKQLENPYSVENMKKALKNVSLKSGSVGDFDISTTDLYVRFLPSDSIEYEALASDTTLELFDYPLDFEIEQEGNWYHDPSIPDHLPTYQYTVVKPSYQFPDTINYEILAELFIPTEADDEETDNNANLKSGNTSDFLDALEDEALRITDNWEELEPATEGVRLKGRRSKWNPSGKIQVEERHGGKDRGYIPVENIKVRVRRWFTIKTDYTDYKGDYRISHKFRRPVNYSVKFETPYAKISNWIGWDTRHDGPKRKDTWNVNFDWHSESWVRATLINAIVEYRVQYHRTGIQNPYPISYWAGGEAVNKLNVRAAFKEGTGSMFALRANNIKIFSKLTRGKGNKETDDLYAVTFHELGHQSHWKLTKWNITWSKKIVRESWADFIEYTFIQQYYSSFANLDKTHKQTYTKSKMSDGYSAIFIDLVDNENQRNTRGHAGSTDYPDDKVSGYTISQLQNALEESRKLEHVRDYLRDKYRNSTEEHLDDLFDFYIDIQ
jgi:hypothetical protein